MLSSNEFAEWSADRIAFLHVTSKVETASYQELLREKGLTGFPSLVFMDEEGEIIARHQGARTQEGIAATETAADAYLALRARALTGDKSASSALLVHDLALGRYGFAEGSLRLDAARGDLTTDQVSTAEATLVSIQMGELTRALRDRKLDSDDYRRQYEKLMLQFYRADRVPTGTRAGTVLIAVLGHAERNGDAALFAEVLGETRRRFDDEPSWARRLARYEEQLAGLRDR